MKSASKLNQPDGSARRTYKTKEDFLRWLREKDRGKGQAAEEKGVPADRANSRALMDWADDGGAT